MASEGKQMNVRETILLLQVGVFVLGLALRFYLLRKKPTDEGEEGKATSGNDSLVSIVDESETEPFVHS